MAVKQTAGRAQLGEFAPKFAQLNDDVLFGEVWSREVDPAVLGAAMQGCAPELLRLAEEARPWTSWPRG